MSMKEYLEIIIPIVMTSFMALITFLLRAAFNEWKRGRLDPTVVMTTLSLLLKDSMLRYYKVLKEKGEVTVFQQIEMDQKAQLYDTLSKSTLGAKIASDVKKLPVIDDRTTDQVLKEH